MELAHSSAGGGDGGRRARSRLANLRAGLAVTEAAAVELEGSTVLTEAELAEYEEAGLVVPRCQLSGAAVAMLQRLTLETLAITCAADPPVEMPVGPHCPTSLYGAHPAHCTTAVLSSCAGARAPFARGTGTRWGLWSVDECAIPPAPHRGHARTTTVQAHTGLRSRRASRRAGWGWPGTHCCWTRSRPCSATTSSSGARNSSTSRP